MGGGERGQGEGQGTAAPDVITKVTAVCTKGCWWRWGQGEGPGCIWQEACSGSYEAELESKPSSCGDKASTLSDPRSLLLSLCKGQRAHTAFLCQCTGWDVKL